MMNMPAQLLIQHKHYEGAAHSFEILTPKDPVAGNQVRPDVAIIKTFFINDEVNANDWQATWEGLKKDAEELPGVPIVLKEDLQHPKFSVQDLYDKGTIFDYEIDEGNKQIIVYARITDQDVVRRIKDGELEYVSPAVIPRGSESMRKVNGVDVLDRTLPLHLCIVGDPAYGKNKAKMTHLCTGNGEACLSRLKMMTASKYISETLEDCVSRKIKIIKDEKPSMKEDQAVAIAYSMCRRGTAGIESDVDPLTQTPLIRKLIASLARTASTIEKANQHSRLYPHDGKFGRWVNFQNLDVFVAENQSLLDAVKEQCGCTRIV